MMSLHRTWLVLFFLIEIRNASIIHPRENDKENGMDCLICPTKLQRIMNNRKYIYIYIMLSRSCSYKRRNNLDSSNILSTRTSVISMNAKFFTSYIFRLGPRHEPKIVQQDSQYNICLPFNTCGMLDFKIICMYLISVVVTLVIFNWFFFIYNLK